MPTKWYAEIYDTRFKIYNILQRRKRQTHEATWSREAFHDFHPHDLEHDGEAGPETTNRLVSSVYKNKFHVVWMLSCYVLYLYTLCKYIHTVYTHTYIYIRIYTHIHTFGVIN